MSVGQRSKVKVTVTFNTVAVGSIAIFTNRHIFADCVDLDQTTQNIQSDSESTLSDVSPEILVTYVEIIFLTYFLLPS